MQLNEIISVNCGVSADVRTKLDACTFVGIDFGTSTTTVTRLVYDLDMQQVVSVPLMIAQEDATGLSCESHLVPTVIATTGNGHLIFGEGAKACLLNDEKYAEGYNIWSEFKMRLGEKACYPHSHLLWTKTPDPHVVIEQPKDAARHFFAFLRKAIEQSVAQEGFPRDVRYAGVSSSSSILCVRNWTGRKSILGR